MDSLIMLTLLLAAVAIPLYAVFWVIAFVLRKLGVKTTERQRQVPGTGRPGLLHGKHWFGAPFYDPNDPNDRRESRRKDGR